MMTSTNQHQNSGTDIPESATIIVCAWCKQKIFTSKLWHTANKNYITALELTVNVPTSHGICPSCAKQMKQDIDTKSDIP